MEVKKIIILSAKVYDFTNKDTGEKLSGIKLKYLFGESLQPIVIDKQERGYQIAECSLSLDKIGSIDKVPGVYIPEYIPVIRGKGQVINKLIDVKFDSTIFDNEKKAN